MQNRLTGKVAAVAGGDQGIERTIAERLAQEGADVAICYRKNKKGRTKDWVEQARQCEESPLWDVKHPEDLDSRYE